MFLLRMLVAQEKESKLSLDRTLAAIDKVTSESLDGYRFFGSNIRVTSSSKLLILIFQAQNLMEVGNKLRAKLLIASGGEDTSPLRPSPSSSRPRSCSSCRSRRSPTREIRQLPSDLAKLNKQIELFDLNIKKLNTTLADERQANNIKYFSKTHTLSVIV